MTLGTRIAVMNQGRIEQVGAPVEIYEHPATPFVARFVGSPAMNLWPARIDTEGDRVLVRTDAFAVAVDRALVAIGATASGLLGVRPHDLQLAPKGSGIADGVVEVVEALGSHTTIHLRLAGAPDNELVRVVIPASAAPTTGETIAVVLDPARLHFFAGV